MAAADNAYCVVTTTCASRSEAETLARGILAGRLAACVQISGISSLYPWKGRIEAADEFRLVIKTVAARYPDLVRFIEERHSYEVPEIVRIPVAGGSAAFLGWIDEVTA